MDELKSCCYREACWDCPFSGYDLLCDQAASEDETSFEKILEKIQELNKQRIKFLKDKEEKMKKTIHEKNKEQEIKFTPRKYGIAKGLVGKWVRVVAGKLTMTDDFKMDGYMAFYYGTLERVETTHIVLSNHAGKHLIAWDYVKDIEED